MSKATHKILYEDGNTKYRCPPKPFEFSVRLHRWQNKWGLTQYIIETEYRPDEKNKKRASVEVKYEHEGIYRDISSISSVTPVFDYKSKSIVERTVLDADSDGAAIRRAVAEYYALKKTVKVLEKRANVDPIDSSEVAVEEEK